MSAGVFCLSHFTKLSEFFNIFTSFCKDVAVFIGLIESRILVVNSMFSWFRVKKKTRLSFIRLYYNSHPSQKKKISMSSTPPNLCCIPFLTPLPSSCPNPTLS